MTLKRDSRRGFHRGVRVRANYYSRTSEPWPEIRGEAVYIVRLTTEKTWRIALVFNGPDNTDPVVGIPTLREAITTLMLLKD